MRLEGSNELFQYWNRLRGNRAAPKRTEVQPGHIKALLANIFILQRGPSGGVAFRLAGTGICETFGRELKNISFASLWADRDKARIDKLLRGILDAKFAVSASVKGVTAAGQPARFELLLLPLDGTDHPHALGSLLPHKEPFWLGLDAIIETHILTSHLIEPKRYTPNLALRQNVPAPPLAPTEISTTGKFDGSAAGRRFRHLVIFDGGRED